MVLFPSDDGALENADRGPLWRLFHTSISLGRAPAALRRSLLALAALRLRQPRPALGASFAAFVAACLAFELLPRRSRRQPPLP